MATHAPQRPAATDGAPNPGSGAPGAADLAQAPDQFPDGPNVAPSPHELQAAQGHLPPQTTPAQNASPGSQGEGAADGSGAVQGTPAAGAGA